MLYLSSSFLSLRTLQRNWSGRGDSNSRSRAPEARALNQARPLPDLVARHGIEPCPLAFQTSTLPSSSRAKTWWTVRELNSHFTGAGRGNPLIRTAHWGEMRESNSRNWSHNPVPKPFGQSRHKTSGAGRVNRTLVGEVQALCTATVLDQQTMELARSLELRSGAYHAPALPVELYQRSWRGDSNADHGLTRPALFLLSYTSAKLWRWRGELHSR